MQIKEYGQKSRKSRGMRYIVVLSLVFFSSCANRGFTISQQIPGYNNNLQALPIDMAYQVDTHGQIVEVQPLTEVEAIRELASLEHTEVTTHDPFKDYTLTPTASGEVALLLGKSSAVRIQQKIAKPKQIDL